VVAGEDRENLQTKQVDTGGSGGGGGGFASTFSGGKWNSQQGFAGGSGLSDAFIWLTAVVVVVAVLLVKLHPHQKEAMVVAAFFQTLLDLPYKEVVAAVGVLVNFQPGSKWNRCRYRCN
jgi:hypothetical protein